MVYPLTFQPLFKERVWGGRNLEKLYGKALPGASPVGESWEISDRPGDESQVDNGPLAGKTLRWLMENDPEGLLGTARSHGGRFPLLVKILDAQEKVSLQVHPPAELAAGLKGEPKTELWYIAAARPGAELYVGLKPGVTRAEFERKISAGTLEECFHRIPVKAGDAMFLPSGRVHAIGAGLVIFEIQQNSDTTYRVFDWNRVGLDGKPRALHIAESLASIDFSDFAPKLVSGVLEHGSNYTARLLVDDPLFKVTEVTLHSQTYHLPRTSKPQIIGLLAGQVVVGEGAEVVTLRPGGFCLVPACLSAAGIQAVKPSTFLLTNPA